MRDARQITGRVTWAWHQGRDTARRPAALKRSSSQHLWRPGSRIGSSGQGYLTPQTEPQAARTVLSSEYDRDDYNAFASLARTRTPVGLLSDSTRGATRALRAIPGALAPRGTPYELRVAFVSRGRAGERGVLGTEGLRALTHARVDTQAGVPSGSTSDYFRTRAQLLIGVTTGSASAIQPAPTTSRQPLAPPPSWWRAWPSRSRC